MTATPNTTAVAPLALTDRGHGGPALLFVPGWCGDRTVFDGPGGIASLAAVHRRVVTVDLPDHGESPAQDDVTTADVVDGLIATMSALGLDTVVPVTLSHAGWAAVELRRRLGAQAVPAVVLLDWMVLGAPPAFADALSALQSPAWAQVRGGLVTMWTDGLDLPELHRYVASMCDYGARHWQRAGRQIQAGFAEFPVPLEALAALQPCPTLHLYAQPADGEVLAAQRRFAHDHPWFAVERLDARSHFPMLEVPEVMVARIESFLHDVS